MEENLQFFIRMLYFIPPEVRLQFFFRPFLVKVNHLTENHNTIEI